MTSAVSALLGVVVGGLLTIAKDWWFENKKTKKNLEYLSIQIITELDKFIKECYDVVIDDGLFQGGYDNTGERCFQVLSPKFDRESMDGVWKSLPTNLMYDIWQFPNKIERADEHINNCMDYCQSPPDHVEIFEERYYQYSLLGMSANKLRIQLCKLCKFPISTTNNRMISVMEKRVLEIDVLRKNNDKIEE